MKKLNNFNEYQLDIILEKIRFDEIILVISDELKSILDSIDHPIANELINQEKSKSFFSKITLLDVDHSNPDKLDNISFSTSTKTIETLSKMYHLTLNDDYPINDYINSHIIQYLIHYKNDVFDKNRSTTSLGRVIGKLFPNKYPASGKPGEDIESFVNDYKATVVSGKTLELVSGNDIIYWYNGENYNQNGGTINNSCMKDEECEDYIKFYAKNPNAVSLLILKDTKNKDLIRGRALVWKLNKPVNRYFMDRVYTVYDSDVKLFIDYAKENNWLYKERQSYTENNIVDPSTNKVETIELLVKMKDTNEYPFMDTLCYYDGDELSNTGDSLEKEDLMLLHDTEGGFEHVGQYSNYYDEWINTYSEEYIECLWIWDYRTKEDCFMSDRYNGYVAYDYAVDNGVICDFPEGADEWRREGDYIKLEDGKTSTKEYANKNFKYNDLDDTWSYK